MSAYWIEGLLWVCRVLRILLIARCLVSCFAKWEDKAYKVFYYATFPFTFILTYPIQRLTHKKKLFFDFDAFIIYIAVLCISALLMNAKVVMGLI